MYCVLIGKSSRRIIFIPLNSFLKIVCTFLIICPYYCQCVIIFSGYFQSMGSFLATQRLTPMERFPAIEGNEPYQRWERFYARKGFLLGRKRYHFNVRQSPNLCGIFKFGYFVAFVFLRDAY